MKASYFLWQNETILAETWSLYTSGHWYSNYVPWNTTRNNVFWFNSVLIVTAFAFLRFHPRYIPTEASLQASTVSFPSGLELLAQPGTALSDITDVVGKYRFADAELMWQVSIIEFHGRQCCGLWESIHCKLWYLTLLECPRGFCPLAFWSSPSSTK